MRGRGLDLASSKKERPRRFQKSALPGENFGRKKARRLPPPGRKSSFYFPITGGRLRVRKKGPRGRSLIRKGGEFAPPGKLSVKEKRGKKAGIFTRGGGGKKGKASSCA